MNARRMALIFACLGIFGLGMGHMFAGKIPKAGIGGFIFSFTSLILAVLCLALTLRQK